jgi:GMP synthase (glutamine-hydrolysing)
MSRVLIVQHVRAETAGTLGEILRAAHIPVKIVRVYDGERVPDSLADAGGLVVMGGPMGVYEQERYPFLRLELRLIEQALKQEKPVLGICLGSQLLAAALGAEVKPGKRKEIGWHRLRLKKSAAVDPLWTGVPSSFTAYHWHGDVFALPHGAVSLASSGMTRHQAFRYGKNAYGFLFHMEVTEKIIEEMVRAFTGELRQANLKGAAILGGAKKHLPRLSEIGDTVFSRWAGLLQARK